MLWLVPSLRSWAPILVNAPVIRKSDACLALNSMKSPANVKKFPSATSNAKNLK